MEFLDRLRIALKGRDKLPPAVRGIIAKEGDQRVVSIDIGKVPIKRELLALGNLISKGKLEQAYRKNDYDTLFHLFCVIHLKDGKSYLMEKNHVIKMEPISGITDKALVEHIDIKNKTLTLSKLMENTAKYMGADYLPYDPVNNNCQHFITGILTGSDLINDDLWLFINQDIQSVIKDMGEAGVLSGLVKKIADWGAMLDVLYHGGKKHERKAGRKYTRKGTSKGTSKGRY
jgi:hypothetical protein